MPRGERYAATFLKGDNVGLITSRITFKAYLFFTMHQLHNSTQIFLQSSLVTNITLAK